MIAAWEDVARSLGWPDQPVGWTTLQTRAQQDSNFRWSHPSTAYASGLLATLAEFYSGAGVQRGLTAEMAQDPKTRRIRRGHREDRQVLRRSRARGHPARDRRMARRRWTPSSYPSSSWSPSTPAYSDRKAPTAPPVWWRSTRQKARYGPIIRWRCWRRQMLRPISANLPGVPRIPGRGRKPDADPAAPGTGRPI